MSGSYLHSCKATCEMDLANWFVGTSGSIAGLGFNPFVGSLVGSLVCAGTA